MAAWLNDQKMALDLYERACEIDLGPLMDSCDQGVHAASYGGIWQCVVNGFCGIRVVDGELRIDPNLPAGWSRVSLPFEYCGEKLKIDITQDQISVVNESMKKEITVTSNGQRHPAEANDVVSC